MLEAIDLHESNRVRLALFVMQQIVCRQGAVITRDTIAKPHGVSLVMLAYFTYPTPSLIQQIVYL